jgi:hypothetical protein
VGAVFVTRIVHIGQGKPVILYNLLDLKRTTWAGPALGAGKHTIVFDFKSDGPRPCQVWSSHDHQRLSGKGGQL